MRTYAALVAVGLLALLAAGCGDDDNGGTGTPTATVASITPSPTYNPTPTGSINAANVCQVNPDPALPDQLQITAPGPSDEVTSPVQITGLIAVFEAQFNIAIKDAGGNDIATAAGHSAEGQTLAPFSESVPFTVSERTPACIWVFDYSPRDGSPSMVHQIPVYLLP